MGKFDAGTAVEAMEYDFTAFGGSAGIIQEPSNEQMENYFNELAALQTQFAPIMAKFEGKDPTAEDLADTDMKALMVEMNAAMGRVVASVTNGTPSEEEVANLPYRVQQAFVGWLSEELSPERAAPATKP